MVYQDFVYLCGITPPDAEITCNIRSNTTNGKYLWWDIADVDVGPELWEVMCLMC